MRKRYCFIIPRVAFLFRFLAVSAFVALPGCADDDGAVDVVDETDAEEQGLAGTNLLRNGFFESPINDGDSWLGHWWTWADYNAPVKRMTAAMWGGTYGIRTTDPTTNALSCLRQAVTGIVPGANYRVWVVTRRRSGAGQQHVELVFYDAAWNILKETRFSAGSDTAWHGVNRTFTAPPGTARAAVAFGDCTRGVAAATYDWDSISLRRMW